MLRGVVYQQNGEGLENGNGIIVRCEKRKMECFFPVKFGCRGNCGWRGAVAGRVESVVLVGGVL